MARYIAASGREVEAAMLQVATDVLADTVEAGQSIPALHAVPWWGPIRIARQVFRLATPIRMLVCWSTEGTAALAPRPNSTAEPRFLASEPSHLAFFRRKRMRHSDGRSPRQLPKAGTVTQSGNQEELGTVAYAAEHESPRQH